MCIGSLYQRGRRAYSVICTRHKQHNNGGHRGEGISLLPGYKRGHFDFCEGDALMTYSDIIDQSNSGMQSIDITFSDQRRAFWNPSRVPGTKKVPGSAT